jgi:hypothetical protein
MDNKSAVPDPPDSDSDIDGCEIAVQDPTPDEDLPPTEGGVA